MHEKKKRKFEIFYTGPGTGPVQSPAGLAGTGSRTEPGPVWQLRLWLIAPAGRLIPNDITLIYDV